MWLFRLNVEQSLLAGKKALSLRCIPSFPDPWRDRHTSLVSRAKLAYSAPIKLATAHLEGNAMLREIWEPDLKVLFVGTAVDEVSDTLGFYHLSPRDRFWESIELGGITPQRIITLSERKALEEGQKQGSVSEPIRAMFIEKKTSLLRKLGIGITDLNRRIISGGDKDKLAWPTEEDIEEFIGRVAELKPKILAFVMNADLFVGLFESRYPEVTPTLGLQSFKIADAEVWLLGSTASKPRGEALTQQEDAFFALGERIPALPG